VKRRTFAVKRRPWIGEDRRMHREDRKTLRECSDSRREEPGLERRSAEAWRWIVDDEPRGGSSPSTHGGGVRHERPEEDHPRRAPGAQPAHAGRRARPTNAAR
jgi:hypothetical protein